MRIIIMLFLVFFNIVGLNAQCDSLINPFRYEDIEICKPLILHKLKKYGTYKIDYWTKIEHNKVLFKHKIVTFDDGSLIIRAIKFKNRLFSVYKIFEISVYFPREIVLCSSIIIGSTTIDELVTLLGKPESYGECEYTYDKYNLGFYYDCHKKSKLYKKVIGIRIYRSAINCIKWNN